MEQRSAKPEFRLVCDGLRFPEGPIAQPDGSLLLVEIARRTLTRVSPQGKRQIIAELGGGPNGAAPGPGGKIYVANNGGFDWLESADGRLFPGTQPTDYAGGSIQIVDPETGKFETLYDACEGRKLRGPNDLVFDAAGGFWFTDLGKTRERDSDRGAVYYAKADGSRITEAIFPLERPNGCGLSPDGNTLYVAETTTARCWAYPLSAPGQIARAPAGAVVGTPSGGVAGTSPSGAPLRGDKGRLVAGLGGFQMFDSMAVDAEGHVCIATLFTGAVTDLWPDGSRADQYLLPEPMVTNVCFGGPQLRTAYATLSSTGRLVAFDWPRAGLPLQHENLKL